jgi:uncharacterized membrane protein SpoIIM required for sporulation
MSIPIWTKASSRRKRILTIILVFVVAFAIMATGSLVPVDKGQAKQISDDLNQTVSSLSDQGVLTQYIFGNNFLICLLMFVPIIGPLLGLLIISNTGTAIGAIATASGTSPILALVALFVTPVAWLEFAAYSTAISESVWLFWRLIRGKGLRELKNTCIFISICAVLLVAGAIVEVALISLAG